MHLLLHKCIYYVLFTGLPLNVCLTLCYFKSGEVVGIVMMIIMVTVVITNTCVLTVCQTLYLVLHRPFSPFAWKNMVYIFYLKAAFSSVQSLSRVRLFATPWTAARQASLSITNSWSLLTLMSIESMVPSNHLILCHPLLLLPSIFPSIRVFSSESALRIRWPKYWSFSFTISPSSEHPGLISFRMGWLYLLAFQGILKSLLRHQFKSINSLVCSAFFIVQLSHPYITGKTIALTRRTFVGKVMSLLFNNFF